MSIPTFKTITLPSEFTHSSKYVSVSSSFNKTEMSVFSKVISYCGNGEMWTIDRNGFIHIHQLPTYKLLKKLDGQGNPVISNSSTQDNKHIHTCILPISRDDFYMGLGTGKIEFWNRRKKKPVKTLTGHTGSITALIKFITKNNKTRIVSASTDFTIRFWEDNHLVTRLTDLSHWVNGLCYCNGFIWAACESSAIRVYDEDGKLVASLEHFHDKGVSCIEYNYGEDEIWTAGKDKGIYIFNPKNFEVKDSFLVPFDINIMFYALDGNQSRMIIGSSNTIHIWDCTSRMKILEIPLKGHIFNISSIFSGGQIKSSSQNASKKDIWIACSDRKIRVYSLDDINRVVKKAVDSDPVLKEHFQTFAIEFEENNDMTLPRDRSENPVISHDEPQIIDQPQPPNEPSEELEIDESVILDLNHRSVFTQTEQEKKKAPEIPSLKLAQTFNKSIKSPRKLNSDRPKKDSILQSPRKSLIPNTARDKIESSKNENYEFRKLQHNNTVLNDKIDKQQEEIKQLKEFISDLTHNHDLKIQELDVTINSSQNKVKELETLVKTFETDNKILVEEKEDLTNEISTIKNNLQEKDNSINEQLSDKETSLSNLKKEISNLKQQNQDLKSELQKESQRANKFELDLSLESEGNKKIIEELSQSKEEISLDNTNLKNKHDDMRKDLIRLQCEQEEKLQKANDHNKKLQSILDKELEEENKLKKEIENLKEQINNLNKKNLDQDKIIKDFEVERDQNNSKFEEERSLLSKDLLDQISKLNDQLFEKDKKIEELNNNNSYLQETVDYQRNDINLSREELIQKEDDIERLLKDAQDSYKEKELFEEKLKQLEEKLSNDLKDSQDSFNLQKEERLREIEVHNHFVESLTSKHKEEVDNLTSLNEDLLGQVQALTQQLKLVDLQRDELQKRLLELQNIVDDQTSTTKNLEEVMSKLQDEKQQLEDKNQNLENQISQLNGNINEDLDKRNKEVESLNSQNSDLSNQLAAALEEINKLKNESSEKNTRIEELELNISQQKADLSSIQETYEEQISSLSSTIQNLNEDIKNKSSSNSEQNEKLIELEEKSNLLQSNLEEKENSLNSIINILEDKENIISQLTQQLQDLNNEKESSSSYLEELSKQKGASDLLIEEKNKEIEELEKQKEENELKFNETINDLQSQIDNLKQSLEYEKQALLDAQASGNDKELREKELESQVDELKEKQKEKDEALNALNNSIQNHLSIPKNIPQINLTGASSVSFDKISEKLQSMLSIVETDLM